MKVFGILNITPDSFSDGNQFIDEEIAVKHARELAKKCDVVDIGAQSTRPDAEVISVSEEITRLGNVIKRVSEFTKVSIDSFNFETQNLAIQQGALYLNDVSAYSDTRMLMAAPDIYFIFMHHLTIPSSKSVVMESQKQDMIKEIKRWALDKIDQLSLFGIKKNHMIFDIGIGFGKSATQSLYLVEHAHVFLDLGVEIMVGHSRKSFMTLLKAGASVQERDEITRQITKDLLYKGIQCVRVHSP